MQATLKLERCEGQQLDPRPCESVVMDVGTSVSYPDEDGNRPGGRCGWLPGTAAFLPREGDRPLSKLTCGTQPATSSN